MSHSPLVLFVVCLTASVAPAVEPGDILPKGMTYDPAVPTPEKHLGFQVGERHLYHHEVVGYLKALAEKSDRVKLQEYARTYGGRPLVALTITSPANHKRLEEIRADHLRLADPKAPGSSSRPAAGGHLDGLRRPRQRAQRHQRRPAGRVPPRRRDRGGPREAARRGGRAARPVPEPGRVRPVRPLGQRPQGDGGQPRPEPPRTPRGVAHRADQLLLVRPQPRLAAGPAPREPRPAGDLPPVEAERRPRLPRDGQQLDLLLPARRPDAHRTR